MTSRRLLRAAAACDEDEGGDDAMAEVDSKIRIILQRMPRRLCADAQTGSLFLAATVRWRTVRPPA
jgi:hypothetical protein